MVQTDFTIKRTTSFPRSGIQQPKCFAGSYDQRGDQEVLQLAYYPSGTFRLSYGRQENSWKVFLEGEFIGGFDIMKQMHENGELEDVLKQD